MSYLTPSSSSEDTLPAKPTKKARTRRSHRKVRSGCLTCKIRRKKCDETKPSCLRCTSTGRKCDGYLQTQTQNDSGSGSGPTTSNDDIQRQQQRQSYYTEGPALSTSIATTTNHISTSQTGVRVVPRTSHVLPWQSIPRHPAMQLFVSEIDLQCFDYFRMVTAQQLGAYHDSSVWRNFVVRTALVHPVILKSTAALGAVHRRHDLGISREAFQYCGIANRLFNEAKGAFDDFMERDVLLHEPYANEIVMMAKLLHGVFHVFQGDYEHAAANMTYGLAALWNRPTTVVASHTQKYGARVHPHIFTDLHARLGRFAVQLLGRKYIILADHRTGQLPAIPTSFPSLQYGLDLLYTQIEFLCHVPTSLLNEQQKLHETQAQHVQYILRWNAALAETTALMPERSTQQIQSCFLLRRIRCTIWVLLYLVLFVQHDSKRKILDFDELKNDFLSTDEVADDNFDFLQPDDTSAIDVSDSPVEVDQDIKKSNSEPIIASPALWDLVNQDEDLLTNLYGVTAIVDSFLQQASTFDRTPYTTSMNIDSGIGPPRSPDPQPESSSKVRHLIRTLLQPSSREKILSDVYSPSETELSQKAIGYPSSGMRPKRLYNVAEQICAIEEHAVFAAARQSQIVPNGVEPRWLDVTCFLEERKMLVQYCCEDNIEGVAGPGGGVAWTEKWVRF